MDHELALCPLRDRGDGTVELFRMADILAVNRHPDVRDAEYRIDPDDTIVYETVGVRGAKHLPLVWDSQR